MTRQKRHRRARDWARKVARTYFRAFRFGGAVYRPGKATSPPPLTRRQLVPLGTDVGFSRKQFVVILIESSPTQRKGS